MCHRVHGVIDAELKSGGCVMHGHAALVDPLKKFADVVIVIQNHLQISMRVAKPEKLYGPLAGENVWRRHLEGFDFVENIENGI